MIARRILAHLTVLVGAFTAVWAMTVAPPRNFAFVAGGDRLDVLLDSDAAAATLAAVVAVVVAVTVRHPRIVLVASGFAVVLLAASSFGTFAGQLHLRAVAAGLILGGCAALTGTRERRTLQGALVIGALAAIAIVPNIGSVPRRYADYLEGDPPQTYLLIAVAVFVVLLLVSRFDEPAERVENRGRVVTVGTVVPVVGLTLYWLFERSVGRLGTGAAMESRWLLGIAVVPLLVAAAFVLPRTTGAVVLAALAYLSAAQLGATDRTTSLLYVALLSVGALVGWRRPSPLPAFVVLALVAAAGILADSPLETVELVATTFVAPFAIGLLYASLLPTSAPVAAVSVTTPIAVAVPIVAEFGWTAYTPLNSTRPAFSPSTWDWTSTAIAVASVIAAGASYMVLRARPR